MEASPVTLGIAALLGWWSRGTPTIEVGTPVSQPCACQCNCDCPENKFQFPYIFVGLIITLICLVGIVWILTRPQPVKRFDGSPKGGKGTQGVSGPVLQLTR